MLLMIVMPRWNQEKIHVRYRVSETSEPVVSEAKIKGGDHFHDNPVK
jgi:hypothetical protein